MGIKVVVARPGLKAVVTDIEGDFLTAAQGIVGGYIEAIPHSGEEWLPQRYHAYANEDGIAAKLTPNFQSEMGFEGLIRGPVIFSRANDDGDEIGLTDEEAERLRATADRCRMMYDTLRGGAEASA